MLPLGLTPHIHNVGHHYINSYIEVDHIGESLEKIEKSGGNKAIGPFELPNGQIFAWFIEVAGNTVGGIIKSNPI